LISEASRLKRIADQKLSIVNPGTSLETRRIIIALIIIVNNPRVKIFIGSVRRISKGLRRILKIPKSNATQRAVVK
jgi:hypothetical protein